MSIEDQGLAGDPHEVSQRLGAVAVVLCLFFAVIVGCAVSVAWAGDDATGSVLAWFAIVGTAVTFVMGAAAIVTGRGRRWGVVAVVSSILVNPWIMTQLLTAVGTLTTR